MKKSARTEALEISKRLLAPLINFPVKDAEMAAEMRVAVGKYLVNFYDIVSNKIAGTELLKCFELARLAGATLNSMNKVRVVVLAEVPTYNMGEAIINAAIIFSFVEQSKMISTMEFKSRVEVDTLMDAMSAIIEEIKLTRADSFVSSDYQSFIFLAAVLIQHMSATERMLPRIVKYNMPVHFPALTLANRIYGDGSRSEELIAENKAVHPAFMQRDIIALSS
jgi:prophage DNA circulation protein